MSLTETEKEGLLEQFYRERLMPIAEQARVNGVDFFPMGADPAVESYYIERNDDGNYVHEINANDLTGELSELWGSGKLPELAELAAPIIALAEEIKETEETNEDVSPFIYAMF